jgi:hypothetical protein
MPKEYVVSIPRTGRQDPATVQIIARSDTAQMVQPGHIRVLDLVGELAAGWQLVQSLQVILEQDTDGSFLVSDDVFLVYGVGDTAAEALHDYYVSLMEYYEFLSTRLESNPHNQNPFRHLRLYLRKTDRD